MDHNLEDELNLESAIGVDFEHSEDVIVSQADISLSTNTHDTEMAMEFEHIEEQPMLMDTTNEEVIEFMGDQFSLQSYPMSDNETAETSGIGSEQQNESASLVDLQFEQPIISTSTKPDFQIQSKLVAVKTIPSRSISKKIESTVLTSAPRQIAIAPKPPPKAIQASKAAFATKQFAIAPKPMTLVGNKTFKKVSLANLVTGNIKGTTVFGQMGKQLIMVPASGTQKIKVISANTGASTIQAQLIATKNIQTTKPVLAKVIVQGQDPSNQPAVITKILPATSAPQTSYVIHQKSSSVGNRSVVTSPTKSPMKTTKTHEIVTTPKLIPVQASGTTTKKVVISSNAKQNLVLKSAPNKSVQTIKGSVVNIQGQQSQIHQVHIPGKGIQYIRLVSNPESPTKSSVKMEAAQDSTPKSYVFTDSKGNLIQITGEKVVNSQPPPLVLSTPGVSKANSKPRPKLVRLAPLTTTSQVMPVIRSTQSLLAPRAVEETPVLEEESNQITEDYTPEQTDSKEALRAMIAETIPEDMLSGEIQHGEVEVEFERQESEVEDNNSNNLDHLDSSNHSEEHPLIVIPSNFMKEHDHNNQLDDEQTNNNHILDIQIEGLTSYERPQTPPQLSDSETAPNEQDLTSRPRKACNCTKSQCLKLYCDCFANGEFCNRCNCNNCHNNLENEELRQKAIRGCLERNPNAFRPKIGKSKTGGPEIIRRHNKGCNCKRSGCLKNYCECYEAKIACTSICKCVGCRNVEETLERVRRRDPLPTREVTDSHYRPTPCGQLKSPSSFMTNEVIEAVCQCLVAAATSGADGEGADGEGEGAPPDPIRDVLDEFARCLQDIISAAHHPPVPGSILDEGHT